MWSDNVIQSDVIEELQIDPVVDEKQIGVAVKEGVVTLSGHVPSYPQKWAAEKAAKRVYGVKGVADELDVHLPSSHQRTDGEIAQAALTSLKWHSSVPNDLIKVTVSRGWVSLEGTVDWQYQKESAANAVFHLTGVVGITNSIQLKARVKPGEVKAKIYDVFERNADLEARRIGVDVHDNKVILHGNVRSWKESEEAQQAVWKIPGVSEVENDLAVVP